VNSKSGRRGQGLLARRWVSVSWMVWTVRPPLVAYPDPVDMTVAGEFAQRVRDVVGSTLSAAPTKLASAIRASSSGWTTAWCSARTSMIAALARAA